MNYLQKLNALIERRNESEFSERIVSELVYLDGISKVNGDRYLLRSRPGSPSTC